MNAMRTVSQIVDACRKDLGPDFRETTPMGVPHDPQDPNVPHATKAGTAQRLSHPPGDRHSKFDGFVEDLDRGRPPDLPLPEAVRLAFRYQKEALNRECEDWHNPLWDFAWALSGHADLRGMEADNAFEIVDFLLKELGYEWSEFDCDYEGDAAINFILSWGAIKVPPGSSPLRAAERLTVSEPLLDADDVPNRRTPAYIQILNCAAWLALIENGRFFLSQRTAGNLIGASRMTGNRLLKLAVHDGFLRIVKQHGPNPKKRQATEYRFEVGLLPVGAIEKAERIITHDRLREASVRRSPGPQGSAP